MKENSTEIAQIILEKYKLVSKNIALVAGCGSGYEAKEFYNTFQCKTIGIDIIAQEEKNGAVQIMKADITKMPFPDNYFSMIYSYHVIEHIPEFDKALSEIFRVMQKSSLLYIGFPNRNRIAGYIDSSVPFITRIKWNLTDLSMRFKGKFKNEFGAHAGYTQKEFNKILKTYFSTIIIVRNDYYAIKYANYGFIIKLLIKTGLCEFLFPSNYFICIKK